MGPAVWSLEGEKAAGQGVSAVAGQGVIATPTRPSATHDSIYMHALSIVSLANYSADSVIFAMHCGDGNANPTRMIPRTPRRSLEK